MQQLVLKSAQGGSPVIRITLHYLWGLAEAMEPLGRLDTQKDTPKFDLALILFEPKNALQALLEGSVYSQTVRISKPHAETLLQLLDRHTSDAFEGNPNEQKPRHEVWKIRNAYAEFKTAFLAELGMFPAYFVTQKGSHDTLTLLDEWWRMFPDDLIKKAPEALFDVQQAGKCLCYETATACGFHLFRATEAVLRRYYGHVTGGAPPPKIRNIMVYVQAMRTRKCGDERILSVVEQLSKLHRNPLIHPEVALTVDEAISILGIARSAVTAMLSQLPELPQTTGAPPSPQEPPKPPTQARSKPSKKKPDA